MTTFHDSSSEGSPCVHCGLCLDACPTYRLTGLEAESPRGRLYLMDAIGDERMALGRDAARHLDSCLGCLACETACPSGVRYGERIAEFRPLLRAAGPPWRRGLRAAVRRTLRSRSWQRAAVIAARACDAVGLARLRRRLPGLGLVSSRGSRTVAAPARACRGVQPPRARVALLIGCGARMFRPSLVAAAIRVLEENDIAVEPIPEGMCCGALAHHEGDVAEATRLTDEISRHVEASRVDYVVTAAAGCRAALGEAAGIAAISREISELLVELGFREPHDSARVSREIAFHDACHLLHAAHAATPPRAILQATGATVADLGENAICCGSAGTYNLVHPRAATALGRRKGELIRARGCGDVAVANLGCILQMERALALAGACATARVAHPIEYLAEAYEREASQA